MTRRLLVTGATGLVGRNILQECAAHDVDVHAVTSRPNLSLSASVATWHVADLSRPEDAHELVALVRPTHLIHCAWDTRHPEFWNSAENLSWLASTAEMARAFANCSGERFVLAGTGAEYDWNYGFMIEGVTPERPETVYGWCKLAAHNMLQGAAAKLGFSAVTGRVFFTYGPHENSQRFIPYICRTLAEGGTPRLTSGHQLRDILHARDAARALLALLDNMSLAGAVNIGSGSPVTLAQVAATLAGIAGRPDNTGLGELPDRPGDPRVLLPSVRRIFDTAWRPLIDFETGLRETYAWWADRIAQDKRQA